MKIKQYTGNLPSTFETLKILPTEKLHDLWNMYFGSGRPQLKPLWWKIQRDIYGQKLDQKHITKLNNYSQNPNKCVENSHATKYHIKPGTQLVKIFKGKSHVVTVNGTDTFIYDGHEYKSLSAIASIICNHKVSGYDFFGFNKI